jgi:hypothetical protein
MADCYLCMGGGIYCEANAKPVITYCVISNNLSHYHGGGIGVVSWYGFSEATINNCIITGNHTLESESGGGGIACVEGKVTVNQCTIVGNIAVYGGGISFDGPSLGDVITSTIVWGNNASYMGPQIAAPGELPVSYSDIQGGWPGTGNIDTTPLFADPNNGDYHLKSQAGRWNPNTQNWVKDDVTSPCIDAGDPNSDWKAELWPNGKRINMGAYGGTPEASMSLSTAGNIADLDNDGDLDYNDVKLFTEKWLKQEVLLAADLDRNGAVDFKDYAIFANEWFSEYIGD